MCLRNRRLRRELTSVVPVAVSSTGRPDLLGTVSLVPESASLLSGRGQTAVDTVLVLVVADPVDLGIVLDDRACGVHEDDLVPLVLSICSDPVAVQNLEFWYLFWVLSSAMLWRDLLTMSCSSPFLLALLPDLICLFLKAPFLTFALTRTYPCLAL